MRDLPPEVLAGEPPRDLLGDFPPPGRGRPAWRKLPASGFMRAARVPLPEAPAPKQGERRIRKVDSFAGGGGASEGCELAMRTLLDMGLLPDGHGTTVDYAVNHDEAAIAMHAANHPLTVHLPHNVWQVSMRELLGDDYFGLLWLSPDCRDHSNAKGGPITSRSVRDLAWVLLLWLDELPDWQRPWTICLENVGAFSRWSPLIQLPDGTFKRDPDREGETFYRFVKALARRGYSVGWKELVACEYGDPTIRRRLYLVARRDGEKVAWPAPTHGDPRSEAVRSGKLQPWPVAADILDFGLPAPSVLMTKEEAREYTRATGIRIKRPTAEKSEARVAKGVKRYVLDAGDEAFLVTLNHGGEFRGQGLGAPMATVAASRDAHGLVVPHLSVLRNSDKPFSGADEATHTVTAEGAALNVVETALAPCIVGLGGRMGQSPPRSVAKPWQTVTAKADAAMVAASLAPFVSRGQHGGGNRSAEVPHHTVAASDGDTNQVVSAAMVPYLVPRYGEREGQEPRTADIARPAPTTVPDGNGGSLAVVYLAQHNTDMVGHDVREAVSTVVQKGCTQAVVAAHLTQFYGSNETASGGDAEAPLAAVRTGGGKGGGHAGLVTVPLVTAYYSSGGQHAGADDPMLTVPTKARFGLTFADMSPPPLTKAQWASARRVAIFLRRYGCWDEREIVTVAIRGVVYVIVDIGMRMLTPRELARAQGFPDSYILDAPYRGGRLSETEQRHKIGNSVCRRPAAAVIVENYRPPLAWGRRAYLEAAE